jgi:multiple sugar transport system substrate-binding protein
VDAYTTKKRLTWIIRKAKPLLADGGITMQVLEAKRKVNRIICLAIMICFVASITGYAAQSEVHFVVNASVDRVPLYEDFFAAFEEKTGIKVQFQQAPGPQVGKWEQVITQIAGGLSPDIVGAVSVEFAQYADKGLLLPIDDFIMQDKVAIGQLLPTLVEALQWRGAQFMLPYGASAIGMFISPQLYDEAGLALPPSQWNQPDWTWDLFLNNLRKMTRIDGSGVVTQFGLAGHLTDAWISLPYNWGGDWISADYREFAGDKPGALAALQAQQDIRYTYHVAPLSGESGGGTAGFISGTAATAVIGTWSLQSIIDSPRPLRMIPWFKVGDNMPKGTINPMGIAILSTAPNQEEAWEFVKFATTDPTGNYLYALAAGALPSHPVAYRRWQNEMQASKPTLNIGAFVQQVAEYPAIINVRKISTFNEIDSIMIPMFNQITNNQISPETGMAQIAPVIQALIDQAGM